MSDYLYKIYSITPQNHEKQYKCKACPFKAATLASLTQHAKLHRGPLDHCQCSRSAPEHYRCYYCHFTTDLLVKYNDHVEKTKHEDPTKTTEAVPNHLCVKCSFGTFSRLVLYRHVCGSCVVDRDKTEFNLASLQGEATENRVEILYYDPQTLQISSVKNEVVSDHPPRPKQSRVQTSKKAMCEQCGQVLCSTNSLKFHITLKHTAPENIKWIECPKCPYKAKLRNRFITHMQYKHTEREEDKMYKCSLCPYVNLKPNGLRHHFKHVHAEGADAEWFQCRFCPHKTRWRNHLRRHESEQHRGDFKMFQCEHCPYRAKQGVHLRLHVAQKHTPDEEVEWFRCGQCDYKAKLKASLKSHILKKHTSPDKVDWFVCDKCGFKALERGVLTKHMGRKH